MLSLLDSGLAPIPLATGSKIPPKGFPLREFLQQRATEAEIDDWCNLYPDTINIGVVTGAISGIDVIDLDPPHEGWPPKGCELPTGLVVSTPRGGAHRYIRHIESVRCSTGIIHTGVDVRADGGYIVVPPSVVDGKPYQYACGSVSDIDEAEPWIREALLATTKPKSPSAKSQCTDPSQGVPQGQRNNHAAMLAGSYFSKGLSETEVLTLLLSWNQRNSSPLPALEIQRVVTSIGASESRKECGGRVLSVCAAEVEPEETMWEWYERLVSGGINLLMGDPGVCKSTVTLNLAATISNGGKYPDGSPATRGATILLSAEDHIAQTIRPRLDKAGADPAMVHILQATLEDGKERLFSLARDIEVLENEIQRIGNVRMVVIDPMSAYLGSGLDAYRDNEVRGVIAPLAAMAERTGVAVIVVTHMVKSGTGSAIHRALGSIGFVAAARTAWLVYQDTDNPDQRILAPVKNNLAPQQSAIEFEVDDGRIVWGAEVEVTADQLLGNAAAKKSEAWLLDLLAGGLVAAETIKSEGAEQGHPWRTLNRIKKKLKIQSQKEGFGKDGQWYWSLPDA